MIRCPKCNKELADETKFCDDCGTPIIETVFCPNCGEQMNAEFAFCQKCGAAIAQNTEVSEMPKENKKSLGTIFKKFLIIGGISALAIIAIVIIVFIFLLGKNTDKYSLYLKEGKIYYTDFSKDKPLEITPQLESNFAISDYEMVSSMGTNLASYIAFNEKGNRIFFPNKIDDSFDGVNLYYYDINKPEKEAIEIDSDVSSYAINRAGDQVIYIKGLASDGILYKDNFKDKEKIASNVVSFNVADDCKKIAYLTDEGNYYLWTSGKEKVKLASYISSIEYISDDLSVIYYIKDGALYKQVAGQEEREKIASDISKVINIYDSGQVYYTKAKSTTKNLMDYVTDDTASTDSNMIEPQVPEYPETPRSPSWWDYDTDEEYEAVQNQYKADYEAYQAERDRLYEEYQKAYDAYQAKNARDALRENLANQILEKTEYMLYFFDGKESSIVTDALVSDDGYLSLGAAYALNTPLVVFQAYNQSNIQKVNLSEITSVNEVSDLIDAVLYSSFEWYTAMGDKLTIIVQNTADDFWVSPNGDVVYFIADITEEGRGNYGDLYKVSIVNGQVATPELYDDNVYRYAIRFISNESISYYKNVDDNMSKGDFIIDKTVIDYDVSLSNLYTSEDTTYYFTDWNMDKQYGTLMMVKKGDKTRIGDDVHDFTLTGKGDILYLNDYSVNYYRGTLYRYNNGKPKKIDDDVVTLIPVYDYTIRGDVKN